MTTIAGKGGVSIISGGISLRDFFSVSSFLVLYSSVCSVGYSVDSGKGLCSDFKTLIYHQSVGVIAVRCESLES